MFDFIKLMLQDQREYPCECQMHFFEAFSLRFRLMILRLAFLIFIRKEWCFKFFAIFELIFKITWINLIIFNINLQKVFKGDKQSN